MISHLELCTPVPYNPYTKIAPYTRDAELACVIARQIPTFYLGSLGSLFDWLTVPRGPRCADIAPIRYRC